MLFDELQKGTGIDPKRLRGIIRRLALRKRVEISMGGNNITITNQGREISRRKIYNMEARTLVRNTADVKTWLEQRSKNSPRSTATFDDVRRDLPSLVITNQKIGRILISLGCTRHQHGAEVSYEVPRTLIFRELRDLTRTKRAHLREGRDREQRAKTHKNAKA